MEEITRVDWELPIAALFSVGTVLAILILRGLWRAVRRMSPKRRITGLWLLSFSWIFVLAIAWFGVSGKVLYSPAARDSSYHDPSAYGQAVEVIIYNSIIIGIIAAAIPLITIIFAKHKNRQPLP